MRYRSSVLAWVLNQFGRVEHAHDFAEIDSTLSDWLLIAPSSDNKSDIEDYISDRLAKAHEDLLAQGSATLSQVISNL